MFLSILGHVLFFGVLLCCLVSLVFGLPGTFLILGTTLLYGIATDFREVGAGMLVILTLVTLAGEGAEYLLGVVGAKHYGSSNRGIVFSMVGGFFGALLFAPLFFGFGAILGALIGAFLGAVAIELLTYGTREWKQAVRSGWGNFLGRIAGMITKISIAIGMIVWIAFTILS